MNTFAKIIVLLVLSSYSFAQTNKIEKTLTNAEEFAAKSGSLIERVFKDVGKIESVKIKVVTFTDLISNKTLPSLRFEKESYSSYSKSTDTKIASLDKDEVDGLIKSLEIMKNDIVTQSRENYTEVTFRSRGGFEAGCFSKKNNWEVYLKLEKYDSKSYQFFKINKLASLIELIKQAKLLM